MSQARRVLVAGVELARILRDEGFEAIDLGDAASPDAIVAAAIDEDVDAVCVPSGAASAVAAGLTDQGARIAVIEVVDPESVPAAIRAAIG